jgi:hypothetical protein
LPTGLTVQKNNRDDTIINQEGNFFLQAIRNGSYGLDELTNYVDGITVGRTNSSSALAVPLDHDLGKQIIGALSLPKYEFLQGRLYTNTVMAKVRALSGSASEKNSLTRANDLAFSYLLLPEILPYSALPAHSVLTNFTAGNLPQAERIERSNRWAQAQFMAANLHELKLTLRWPVFERRTAQGVTNWVAGGNAKTFRTLISGRLASFTNQQREGPATLYLLTPSVYSP